MGPLFAPAWTAKHARGVGVGHAGNQISSMSLPANSAQLKSQLYIWEQQLGIFTQEEENTIKTTRGNSQIHS